MRFALLALVLASGCTHLVWYGRSADRRHVAAVIERGGKQLVRYDSKDGFAFAGIGVDGLQVDETHVVYPAQLDDGGWVVVSGTTQSTRFDAIGAVVLRAGRLAVAAERGGKWFVVQETKESGPWDEVLAGSLQLSRSGETLAFAARRGGKVFVVAGDEEHGPFDAAGQVHFLGERVIFTNRTTEGVFVHAPSGGVLGPWDDVVDLTTSDTRFAFAARDVGSKEWRVFRAGALSAAFERVAGLTFTEDRLVFAARTGGNEFVVDGERQLGPFTTLKRQLLSIGGGLFFAGKRGDRWWVFREGRAESGPWDDVSSLVASGSHDAFLGEREGRSVVVVDGVEQREWELAMGLTLNSAGKPLYFARAGSQSLVVDGERTTPYDLVLGDALVYARDGKHFGAVTGEKKTKQLFVSFDDGARVPVDLEELTAAMTRVPPEALLANPQSELLKQWVEAELQLHFGTSEKP